MNNIGLQFSPSEPSSTDYILYHEYQCFKDLHENVIFQ